MIILQIVILLVLLAAIIMPNTRALKALAHRFFHKRSKADPNALTDEDLSHRHMVMSILPYMSQVPSPTGEDAKVLMLEITSMDGRGKVQTNTMLYTADTAGAVGQVMLMAAEQMKSPTPKTDAVIPDAPKPGTNPHGYL